MEIRNLVTFKKIIELGSFSHAAEALGYSQSTVTMQMKQLEEELGLPLFDRIGRRVQVNNEGLRFLEYAKRIITESENCIADLTSDAEPGGTLCIGILESVCTAHLPRLLHQYHTAFPQVNTIIKMGSLPELSQMLDQGQIDILWTFDHPIHSAAWVKAFQYESPIVVVCSNTFSLASKKELTLSQIADEPFILTERDCSYRNDFVNNMLSLGYTPNVFLEISSTEIIKKFIEADLGLSVLPRYTIEKELSIGQLIALPVSDFHLTMYGQLFYHKRKWMSPALSYFTKLVSEQI